MEVTKLPSTTDRTRPLEPFTAESSGRHSEPNNALSLTLPDTPSPTMRCFSHYQTLSLHFTDDRFSFLLHLPFAAPAKAHFDIHKYSLISPLHVSASFTPSSGSASPTLTTDSNYNKLLEQLTLRYSIVTANVNCVRVHITLQYCGS
jgi:hypothetical protein